jgi:predicted RNase H-like HicB family nuclease
MFHQAPSLLFSSKHNSKGEDEMYRFLVIIEKGDTSYGAYCPDLPGCVAVGRTREEVEQNMREAIAMHIQGMIEENEPIPSSHNDAEYMDISLPT